MSFNRNEWFLKICNLPSLFQCFVFQADFSSCLPKEKYAIQRLSSRSVGRTTDLRDHRHPSNLAQAQYKLIVLPNLANTVYSLRSVLKMSVVHPDPLMCVCRGEKGNLLQF
jgi:hypothetical protein